MMGPCWADHSFLYLCYDGDGEEGSGETFLKKWKLSGALGRSARGTLIVCLFLLVPAFPLEWEEAPPLSDEGRVLGS